MMQETIIPTDGVIVTVEKIHAFNWVDMLIVLAVIMVGILIIRRKYGTKKNGDSGFAAGGSLDGGY